VKGFLSVLARIRKALACTSKIGAKMIQFTIDLPPRTKKNSQQIIVCKGRPMIIPSKLYKQYENDCALFMPKIDTIDYPVNIKAVYYMPTKRRVDLCNLHEALCDILVRYKIVSDDNSSIISTMDGSCVRYDKEKPRTEVTIERI
jgi:Holliday junction resolvase RusA-like endonuclease